MYLLADQTVDEALRRGRGPGDIDAMISLLMHYPLGSLDVGLDHWTGMQKSLEQTGLQALLRCLVFPSVMAVVQAAQLGFARIMVQWSHHPEQNTMGELAQILAVAKESELEVGLALENASRFSANELLRYQDIIHQYDLDCFIYQDQDSILEPFKTYRNLKALQQAMSCPLEFHAHNNLGLATANALAALRAGVRTVGSAIGGVGLPGHAAAEELLMATTHIWKQENAFVGRSLAQDCVRILGCMGIEAAADKAIIGSCVFDHESGIHVDGIRKNPSLYEAYHPETVGLSRTMIIGKHSGTAALKQKFLHWHIALGQGEALRLLEQVREIATSQKGAVSDQQLRQLYQCNRTRDGRTDEAAEDPERGCR